MVTRTVLLVTTQLFSRSLLDPIKNSPAGMYIITGSNPAATPLIVLGRLASGV
jgi:hypothetical protein